jgi:hypothetical protein
VCRTVACLSVYVYMDGYVHVPWTHPHLQATPVAVHIPVSTLIHWRTNDNSAHWKWQRRVGHFYKTVHSVRMGQQGPKHVGVCVLKHYCNFNDVCAFVGHTVNSWIIMHGIENKKNWCEPRALYLIIFLPQHWKFCSSHYFWTVWTSINEIVTATCTNANRYRYMNTTQQ